MSYPFTAPEVRPAINDFCANIYIITTGTTDITAPGIKISYAFPYGVMVVAIPIRIVNFLSFESTISGSSHVVIF